MPINYTARRALVTCSLGFFCAMLVPSFILGLVVGIGAWIVLAAPTLTALLSESLVAHVFRYFAGRRWGLPVSALLGGVLGVVNLYAGTFLFSLPKYFDPANASHWQELFVGQLLLANIPAVPLLIFPATAAGGAFIWRRLRELESG